MFKVDGDTDTIPVQEDFNSVLRQHIQFNEENRLSTKAEKMVLNGRAGNGNLHGRIQNGHLPNRDDTTVHDLEELDSISRHVQNGAANGKVMNGVANGNGPKAKPIGNGFSNGKLASLESQRRENIRNLYQGYQANNHM